jgi:hypothetical protein
MAKAESQKSLKGATAKEYVRMQRTLTRITEYVNLGLAGSLNARNDAIETGNVVKFPYSQGTVDIFLDLNGILEGRQLVVFTQKVPAPPKDPSVG